MRIAIDINRIRGQKSGIGYYAHNLITQLAKLDKTNEYLLYAYYLRSRGAKMNKDLIPSQKNFKIKINRAPQKLIRFLWEKINIPIEYFLGDIDILHSTDGTFPPVKHARLIVTIHDLAFLLFPQYTAGHRYVQNYMKQHILKAVIRADKIITCSNNSKKDIIELLKVADEKIHVIYEGVDSQFQPIKADEDLNRVRTKYQLPQKFILNVGTLEPRKNIPMLLKTIKRLKANKEVNHKLVLVGGKGWLHQEVFNLVEKLNLQEEVIFKGYVPVEDLPCLYCLSDIFVFPTFYEGFGLPLLEAMACGTPVICSNTSSIPEVVGDAGLFINPYDEEGLLDSIMQIINDSTLRNQLIEKGLRRARFFSWQNTAEETIKIYHTMCS